MAELVQRFGEPVTGCADLGDSPYLRKVVEKRFAEVCMVVRRASGRLLVFRKPFYPAGVFRLLTGGGSQLAIVASTLVIAALFNPLRRLIQTVIDRRFYREKYDARGTLEAFSARLRDQTSLDSLSGDLVSVVEETMQPEYVSMWVRDGDMER